jgi:hypothetical protein
VCLPSKHEVLNSISDITKKKKKKIHLENKEKAITFFTEKYRERQISTKDVRNHLAIREMKKKTYRDITTYL